MAQAVKWLTGLLLAMTVVAAPAQGLPDPTRPAIAPPEGADPEVLVAAVPNGLQSIRRDDRGRAAALIHGQWVTVGGRVGEARLIAIRDTEVVLGQPDGRRETLKLYPDIELTRKLGHASRPKATAR